MEKYSPTAHEAILQQSGLFTQIQPEWLAESEGAVDYICRLRGVFIHVNRIRPDARVFFDRGSLNYYSSGWYTATELLEWWIPCMKDKEKWDKFIALDNGDITEVL